MLCGSLLTAASSSWLGWRDEAALKPEILRGVPCQLSGEGLPVAAAKPRAHAEAAADDGTMDKIRALQHRRGQGAPRPGEAEAAADRRKQTFAHALVVTRRALRTLLLNPCTSPPLA